MVNGRGSAPDIAEIALGRVGTFEARSVDSEGVGVEGNVFERDWATHSVTSGDKQHCNVLMSVAVHSVEWKLVDQAKRGMQV